MMRLLLILAAFVVLLFIVVSLTGCAGATPKNLGVHDGSLAPCPESPNCVNSRAEDPDQRIKPIVYLGDSGLVINKIAQIIKSMPSSKIVKRQDNYLHAEFASSVFGFVDDVEFFVDTQNKLIQIRSAARLGYYDFGVNRTRIEKIRTRLLQETQ